MYFFAASEATISLSCQAMPPSPEPPGDRWLSIVETFEFLPAEEDARAAQRRTPTPPVSDGPLVALGSTTDAERPDVVTVASRRHEDGAPVRRGPHLAGRTSYAAEAARCSYSAGASGGSPSKMKP
jgi:hypothetical protein